MCRYMSKNVDICVDFGRFVPIYVEKCRYLCRFWSICADICRKMSISVDIGCRFRSICVDICRKSRYLCRLLSICAYISKKMCICQYLCCFGLHKHIVIHGHHLGDVRAYQIGFYARIIVAYQYT